MLDPEQTTLIFSVALEKKKGAELFPTSTLQDLWISHGLMHVVKDQMSGVQVSAIYW